MSDLKDIRQRHINIMSVTTDIVGHILKNVNLDQATTLRDGPEGWTILEILCHLRDFDTIFRERAMLILEKDHPELPSFDQDAMAIEKHYNDEDFAYAFDGYLHSRGKTKEFFEGLSDEQWERSGIHPTRGEYSLTDAVIHIVHHDIQHIEQITLLLEQEVPGSGALPSEDLDEENDDLL